MYPDEYYDKRILLSADFLLCTNRKSISKTEHNTNISLYNTAIKKSCFIAVMPWSGMWQNEKTTWFLEFATWFFDFTIRFSEFTTWFLEFTTWFFQFIIRFLEFTISVFQFTTWFFEFTLWFFKFAIRSTQSSGHHIYKIINQKAKIYSKNLNTLYLNTLVYYIVVYIDRKTKLPLTMSPVMSAVIS